MLLGDITTMSVMNVVGYCSDSIFLSIYYLPILPQRYAAPIPHLCFTSKYKIGNCRHRAGHLTGARVARGCFETMTSASQTLASTCAGAY